MHRREGASRTSGVVCRTVRVAMVASVLVLALPALGPDATASAAPSPTTEPALIQGVAWCGHFDHAAADTLPAHFTCPAAVGTSVSLVANAPNGPFSSGQYITVLVGPNHTLHEGKPLYIRECAAPDGRPPTSWRQCDAKTTQSTAARVGPHGTVDYPGYPIYSLPDSILLGEGSRHKPVCDLTHACILFVGQDHHDFDRPHVWSLPFYVHPTPGDSGADPGSGLPEVPSVLALPLIAAGIFGGVVLVRRRRGREHAA